MMGEKTKKVFIRTFGCQMNLHDSERILEALLKHGFDRATGAEEADVIIVNTCSVRDRAYQKVRSAIGSLKRIKEKKKGKVTIVVAGCVARQEGEKWLEYCPHVDVVMGPDAVVRAVRLIRKATEKGEKIVDVEFDRGERQNFATHLLPKKQPQPSAYITIMKGCNLNCTFCIVPLVRGRERCRPPEDIIEEVKKLVKNGTKQLYLLGQTVNSWRWGKYRFHHLIEMVASVEGVRRIRYTSPYPSFVTPELARLHGQIDVLCDHIHLPLQSGSDRILRKMRRGYSASRYMKIIEMLKKQRQDIAITTDIIVGFPTETEQDFKQTLKIINEVEFDSIFSFKYSPRPGTEAYNFPDDISPHIKSERLHQVHYLSDEITQKHWKKLIGRQFEVLVEKRGKKATQLSGRCSKGRIINFSFNPEMELKIGDLAIVKVQEALAHSLRGVAIKKLN